VDDVIFVIRNMSTLTTTNEATEWVGYTFKFGDDDNRRPLHNFNENHLHAPMMANTHCFEKNECFNLALFNDGNAVIFEASRSIIGGDMLIVNYGEEYNNELFAERQAARKMRAEQLAKRVHLSHTFECPICGHTCA